MRLTKGFSLVEVMVSMLIASIALLGLAATQLRALQYATNSFDYTVALVQGQNAMEKIWSRLCDIQHNDPSLFQDEDFREWLLAPSDIRTTFEVIVPQTYENEMNILVNWVDDRMDPDVDGENQVVLNATFMSLDDTCD
ncbi:prepilin-type N-terminal cleavage/methylation domain-containing protein [Pseudoalteromonas sp. MMG022]|uniref:prepilin-type N-terminal cleavage/methylation domain-containing protein n=1 Tax=Pseudoalteromonas sp. MMG022 TaxID=2909978 RepID=UPI001F2C52E8|nr:prepilin-type N-terminal cleavage/methylation domain-containing protein [Pseudoalteromonas sp. MMG022]MCF6435654.1 prepilin-type N-terminal cleavage/methylation domain-containing protein [Pseudoalteromonas sp. MMG022]